MNRKLKYKVGDFIKNNSELTLKVTEVDGGFNESDSESYKTICTKCGFIFEGSAENLEKKIFCPNCEEHPAALKTDEDGNCISICEIGTVEFVREYQETRGVSERKAVQSFIEIVKAKLSADDPVQDVLTEGSIRSKVRRNTGKDKKKAPPKVAHSEPKITSAESEKDSKTYLCFPSVTGVQTFLKKHLPEYKIVPVKCDLKY